MTESPSFYVGKHILELYVLALADERGLKF